jgi:flavin-dependent dehydrogenase
MTGPSEQDAAVEAAINRLVARVAAQTAEDVLATMTDPERGEGAYVRLGDVLDWLRRRAEMTGLDRYLGLADYILHEHREGRL